MSHVNARGILDAQLAEIPAASRYISSPSCMLYAQLAEIPEAFIPRVVDWLTHKIVLPNIKTRIVPNKPGRQTCALQGHAAD